jgi:peptidoglycan/xylan/chitin deacetylase (PgdA/CDA1 family)
MQKQASYIVIYYPKIIIKQIQIILLLVLFSVKGSSQSKIAITIDDVPNHTSTQHLYTELDKLKIPICIFINEGRPLRDSSKTTVNEFLSQWAKRKYVTFGNHTFNHLRYSDVGFDSFKNDITKGEVITKSVVTLKNKKLKYFRFPYNDLGNDSISQSKIKQFISSRGYIIAPFTVESIDWMYNFLYEKFLALNDSINADKIGQAYVHKTMEYIT